MTEANKPCAVDAECGSGRCEIDYSEGVCEPSARQVIERVSSTNPVVRVADARKSLSSAFSFHPPHGHIHFDNYVALRLFRNDLNCLVHPDERDDDPNFCEKTLDCRAYPFSGGKEARRKNANCQAYAEYWCARNSAAWCNNYGFEGGY